MLISTEQLCQAIKQLSLLPAITPGRLVTLARADDREIAYTASIMALNRLDVNVIPEVMFDLLHDADRSRVCAMMLTRAVHLMGEDEKLKFIRSIPMGKVAVVKEKVRLLSLVKDDDRVFEELLGLLSTREKHWQDLKKKREIEAERHVKLVSRIRGLHRDVFVIVLSYLQQRFLMCRETWEAMEDAILSDEEECVAAAIPIGFLNKQNLWKIIHSRKRKGYSSSKDVCEEVVGKLDESEEDKKGEYEKKEENDDLSLDKAEGNPEMRSLEEPINSDKRMAELLAFNKERQTLGSWFLHLFLLALSHSSPAILKTAFEHYQVPVIHFLGVPTEKLCYQSLIDHLKHNVPITSLEEFTRRNSPLSDSSSAFFAGDRKREKKSFMLPLLMADASPSLLDTRNKIIRRLFEILSAKATTDTQKKVRELAACLVSRLLLNEDKQVVVEFLQREMRKGNVIAIQLLLDKFANTISHYTSDGFPPFRLSDLCKAVMDELFKIPIFFEEAVRLLFALTELPEMPSVLDSLLRRKEMESALTVSSVAALFAESLAFSQDSCLMNRLACFEKRHELFDKKLLSSSDWRLRRIGFAALKKRNSYNTKQLKKFENDSDREISRDALQSLGYVEESEMLAELDKWGYMKWKKIVLGLFLVCLLILLFALFL